MVFYNPSANQVTFAEQEPKNGAEQSEQEGHQIHIHGFVNESSVDVR